MKTHLAAVAVVVSVAGAAAHHGAHAAQAQGAPSAQSAFFCDVGVFTPAERTRHFDVLGPALIAKRTSVVELPDGYELQFPSDKQTFQQLSEYIDGERACCPFFDISLSAPSEHAPLRVRFTGRPGTKQFIEADAKGWISPLAAK